MLVDATAIELATTVRTLYTEEAKGRLGAATVDDLDSPMVGPLHEQLDILWQAAGWATDRDGARTARPRRSR